MDNIFEVLTIPVSKTVCDTHSRWYTYPPHLGFHCNLVEAELSTSADEDEAMQYALEDPRDRQRR